MDVWLGHCAGHTLQILILNSWKSSSKQCQREYFPILHSIIHTLCLLLYMVSKCEAKNMASIIHSQCIRCVPIVSIRNGTHKPTSNPYSCTFTHVSTMNRHNGTVVRRTANGNWTFSIHTNTHMHTREWNRLTILTLLQTIVQHFNQTF